MHRNDNMVRHLSEISQRQDACVDTEFATDARNNKRSQRILVFLFVFISLLGRSCVLPSSLKTLFCVQSETLTLTTVKVVFNKYYISKAQFLIYLWSKQTNNADMFDYMYEGSNDI